MVEVEPMLDHLNPILSIFVPFDSSPNGSHQIVTLEKRPFKDNNKINYSRKKDFHLSISMCYTLKILKYSFNRGDTKYHGGLRSRELCQALIMQALSSHSRVCESELFS